MNKIFKLVWNRARRCWVVASELTKSQGKKSPLIACSVLLASLSVPNLAKALDDHPHSSLNDQTFFNGSANASANLESMIIIKAGTKEDGYGDPPLVTHEKDGGLSLEVDPTVDDSIVIERGASLQVGPSMEQSKAPQYFTAEKSMINHGVVNIRNKKGVIGNELHVMGDYHGAEGSVLNFSTLIHGRSIWTWGLELIKFDRMVVYGNTSGTSIVRVTNLGGNGFGGWEDNGPIKLITVHGDSDATFVQDKRIVAGGYDYRLVRGDERYEEGSSKNWYLSDRLPGSQMQFESQQTQTRSDVPSDKASSALSTFVIPNDSLNNQTKIEPQQNQTKIDVPSNKTSSALSTFVIQNDNLNNQTRIEPQQNQTKIDVPSNKASSALSTFVIQNDDLNNQTKIEPQQNQSKSSADETPPDESKTQLQSKPKSARELVEYFLGDREQEPQVVSAKEGGNEEPAKQDSPEQSKKQLIVESKEEDDNSDDDVGGGDNGGDENKDIPGSDTPDDGDESLEEDVDEDVDEDEPLDEEEETPEERPAAPVVRSAPLPAAGKRVVRPEAGSYNSNAWAANTMFQMSLNDRLGSYFQGESDEHRGSAWIRYSGSRNQLDDTSGQLRTKGDKNTVMMGVDMLVHSTDNRDQVTAGLMGGYGHYSGDTRSNLSGYSSRSKVDGYGVGLYGTYQQNADTQQGIYVDSWLLWNAFNNHVKGDDLPREKYRSKGMTGGVELGYNAKIAEHDNVKYVLQPHAQVMYQNVRAENFRESNGTSIEFLNGSRLQTSLGLRAAAHIQTGLTSVVTPHFEANWLHSTKGYGVRMNGADATMDSGRNAAQLKLGVEGQVNKQISLNVEMFRNQGNAGYHETGGNLAVKYRY